MLPSSILEWDCIKDRALKEVITENKGICMGPKRRPVPL